MRYNNSPGGFENDDDRQTTQTSLHSRAEVRHAAGHSVTELKKQLQKLPKGKEIIAYCRGPYCVWAKAADILRSQGFKARHIRDGVQDWAASGLPLKSGKAI